MNFRLPELGPEVNTGNTGLDLYSDFILSGYVTSGYFLFHL